MKGRQVFLVMGVIQVVSLAFILFFVLGLTGVGFDTRVVLSCVFSVFSLIVEYMIYSKR
jgi:hypothetical protein